ncbi:porin [Lutimaribacter marinistellae]|uniref:Porin n=1 Tax=Lutimaribacter marinistellae TaxID=1820329 RepID=A0ABV7TLX9_9RHOB
MAKNLKFKSAVAVCALVAAAPAAAELKYENASGGYVLLYGQFHPGFSAVDDGVDSYNQFADSDVSNSRVGLRLMQPLQGGMEFRFRFETALGFPATSEYDQNGSTGVSSWSRTDLRHIDFSLSGDWGTLSAGQGSMSADGAAEIAGGAISLPMYSYTGDGNGLYQFRTAGGALSGVTIGDVFDNFDGSRRGRIRYDSPTFNGFSVAVAYGKNILANPQPDDKFADIALMYENEFANGIEFEGALAYQWRDRPGTENTDSFIASGAITLPVGLAFAAAYGDQNDKRPGATDPSYWYVQAAYDANFLAVGTTSFGIDYYSGKDYNSVGSDSEAWGVGVLQEFEDANVEAYLTYRNHSFDEVATNYQDVSSWLLGARWKF